LDSVRLVHYDLPPDWNMTLDERCSPGAPVATGEPRFYRHWALPAIATNDRGSDVTAAVSEADKNPAAPGARDKRFIGRTAEHAITLQFDHALDRPAGKPMLIADGWIEYPYSQTMFAAWQAGARYAAPTIEAQDPAGDWHTLLSEFGYPGGMRRQMSVPLPELPRDCKALRIRTNLEVYWDRLMIAWAEPCPDAARRELPLRSAILSHAGFPQRTDGPLRQVDFDYSRRAPAADMRFQRGFYTQYGPILPLISQTDDAVAIFGPGEEISLEFSASAQPLAQGWTRQFVLESSGWCKDMDLYTQHGEMVDPLPVRESSSESNSQARARREDLHREFNTRFMAGD
jgi:hypothetical protein